MPLTGLVFAASSFRPGEKQLVARVLRACAQSSPVPRLTHRTDALADRTKAQEPSEEGEHAGLGLVLWRALGLFPEFPRGSGLHPSPVWDHSANGSPTLAVIAAVAPTRKVGVWGLSRPPAPAQCPSGFLDKGALPHCTLGPGPLLAAAAASLPEPHWPRP